MRRMLLSLIAISFVIAGPALAQEAAEGRPPSHCIALVEDTPGFKVIRAAATTGSTTSTIGRLCRRRPSASATSTTRCS